MNKREFANAVAEMIESAVVKEVEKANGIRLIGITKENGERIIPCAYIDAFYDAGLSIEKTAERIMAIFNDTIPISIDDVSFVTDYEQVKPRLVARLYNAKTNAEVYVSAKEYGFDDLIIVPYIQLSAEAPIKVRQDLLTTWNKTGAEVIADAIENTKAKETLCKPLGEVLAGLMGMPYDEASKGMFPDIVVIGNNEKYCGAIHVLFCKDKITEIYSNGYAIIPSSIHEVLAVPLSDGITEMELANMIQAVNTTEVQPEEVLSDHAYIFGERA